MPQIPRQTFDGQGNLIAEDTIEVSQERVNAESTASKLTAFLADATATTYRDEARPGARTNALWDALTPQQRDRLTRRCVALLADLVPVVRRLARRELESFEADEAD